MSYTSLTDFKARNGITNTKYDAQLTFLLDRLGKVLERETGGIFTLVTKTAADQMRYYGQPGGTNYIKITAWQNDSNLVVKQGVFGSESVQTLVKNADYYLISENAQSGPVVALKFPCYLLYDHCFVQIEGVYGYSNELPSDLEMLLDQAVLQAFSYRLRTQHQVTRSKGYQMQSERSGNLSISFATNPEAEKYAAALNSGNLRAWPEMANTIDRYKSLFTEDVLIT